jgi:hypothetical protein
MNQQPVLTKTRIEQLEQLESIISEAFRRGLTATREIGKAFARIKDENLYGAVGIETWTKYLENRWGSSLTTVDDIIAAARMAEFLEEAGLPLPPRTNQSQLLVLAKLAEPAQRIEAWREIVDLSERTNVPLSIKVVKKAVDLAVKQIQRTSGVHVDLDTDKATEASAPAPTPAGRSITVRAKGEAVDRIQLNEEGEAALERIERLCGKATAEAIESGQFKISDHNLIRWAEQSDNMVRILYHYLFWERWSLKKALDFEEKLIDEETSLRQLLALARASEGKRIVEHDFANEHWVITIERVGFARG